MTSTAPVTPLSVAESQENFDVRPPAAPRRAALTALTNSPHARGPALEAQHQTFLVPCGQCSNCKPILACDRKRQASRRRKACSNLQPAKKAKLI